jgi:uncharacterized protein
VQFLLLLGVAALLYDRVLSADLRRGLDDNERFGMVLMYCALALLLLVRGRFARLNWRGLFGKWPMRDDLPLLSAIVPIDVLTLGTTVAVFIPLSYLAPGFVTRLLLTTPRVLDSHSFAQWLEVVAVACIAAPFVEELLFRGILLHRWARRWGTGRAVIASSLLFAVLHGEWIGHFLFGVAMCALYLRTRTLWLPMMAHALSNFVVSLSTLPDALHPVPSPPDTLEGLRAEWPTGVIALVAGVVLLWWYMRRFWPRDYLRVVLTGPLPYDVYAASATPPEGYAASATTPDSTSAS